MTTSATDSPAKAKAKPTKEMNTRMALVLKDAGNQICADCPTKKPVWASFVASSSKAEKNLGVLCCSSCAVRHHYVLGNRCKLKYLKIAHEWTVKDIAILELSGNAFVNNMLEATLTTADFDKLTVLEDEEDEEERRSKFIKYKYKRHKYVDQLLYHQRMLGLLQQQKPNLSDESIKQELESCLDESEQTLENREVDNRTTTSARRRSRLLRSGSRRRYLDDSFSCLDISTSSLRSEGSFSCVGASAKSLKTKGSACCLGASARSIKTEASSSSNLGPSVSSSKGEGRHTRRPRNRRASYAGQSEAYTKPPSRRRTSLNSRITGGSSRTICSEGTSRGQTRLVDCSRSHDSPKLLSPRSPRSLVDLPGTEERGTGGRRRKGLTQVYSISQPSVFRDSAETEIGDDKQVRCRRRSSSCRRRESTRPRRSVDNAPRAPATRHGNSISKLEDAPPLLPMCTNDQTQNSMVQCTTSSKRMKRDSKVIRKKNPPLSKVLGDTRCSSSSFEKDTMSESARSSQTKKKVRGDTKDNAINTGGSLRRSTFVE